MSARIRQHLVEAHRLATQAQASRSSSDRAALNAAAQHQIQKAYTVLGMGEA